ncbi:MAG: hypothetical protein RL657_1345, partial [Pseudomonadota bacterium]
MVEVTFKNECDPTGDWWSWGDLNPRPQAFFVQFYMCSRLIWISPD